MGWALANGQKTMLVAWPGAERVRTLLGETVAMETRPCASVLVSTLVSSGAARSSTASMASWIGTELAASRTVPLSERRASSVTLSSQVLLARTATGIVRQGAYP